MSKDSPDATQKVEPWEGVQPYLTGTSTRKLKSGVTPIYGTKTYNQPAWDTSSYESGNQPGQYFSGSDNLMNPESDYETTGTPGIFQEAQNLYGNSAWNSNQSGLADNMFKTLQQRQNQSGNYDTLAGDLLGGGFDPAYNAIGYTNAPGEIRAQGYAAPQNAGAKNIKFDTAMDAMGEGNPMDALQRLLSGQVDTTTLDPVVNSALRRMGENFQESYMPSLNSGAMAAGGYGGSRHGIAQGLAGKGLANAMGDTSAGMYNNAYNTAQSNMYGTANSLAGLGTNISSQNASNDLQAALANQSAQQAAAQFNAEKNLAAQLANASNALSTNQFNANLGLSNNSQSLNNATALRENRLQGLNTANAGNALIDSIYGQQQDLLGAGNDYNWRNLSNYAGIVQPGSGIGGTTTTSGGGTSNPLAGALGGASLGMGLMDTALGNTVASAMSPLSGALGMGGAYALPFALLGGLLG